MSFCIVISQLVIVYDSLIAAKFLAKIISVSRKFLFIIVSSYDLFTHGFIIYKLLHKNKYLNIFYI